MRKQLARVVWIAAMAALIGPACGSARFSSGDIVLTYRQIVGGCEDCEEFELEFRRRRVQFRGLNSCSPPGTHGFIFPPERFDALVEAFHDARFFEVPRLAAYRRQMHTAIVTIGYRDSQRTHETLIDTADNAALVSLGTQLRDAVNLERLFEPSRELYEELVKAHWNVNATGELDGRPALDCAVRAGGPEAVRVLLEHGAMPTRSTWLHAAARRDADVLKLFYGLSPLDWTTPLATDVLMAAAGSEGQTLDYLLSRGAPANAVDDRGRPALMRSISLGGEVQRSTGLLLMHGADPNARDRSGATPLHNAAASLSTGFITRLVAAGADVEARDADGRTPVMVAADRCYYWNVKALLQAGADPQGVVAPDWSLGVLGPNGTHEPKCLTTQGLLSSATAGRPRP
jgi:ankyrin repeat protein